MNNLTINAVENGFSWEISQNGNQVLTYNGNGITDLRYESLTGTRFIATKTKPIVALVALRYVKNGKLLGKFKISAMRDLYSRVRALVNAIYTGNFSTAAWLCKHVPELVTENQDLFAIAVNQVKNQKNRIFPNIYNTEDFDQDVLAILMGDIEPNKKLMKLMTKPMDTPITDQDAEEFFS
jgi:hypothetical protein